MTVICALHQGGETWIGSDTRSVRSGYLKVPSGPKWSLWGTWAVGVSGRHRLLNVLGANTKRLFDDLDGPFDFTERVHALLKESDFDLSPGRDEAAPNNGSTMILAALDGVWAIGADFSIVPARGFWADGSGGGFALGAAHACAQFSVCGHHEAVLRCAIEAAMKYDTGCGGEAWIHRIEP